MNRYAKIDRDIQRVRGLLGTTDPAAGAQDTAAFRQRAAASRQWIVRTAPEPSHVPNHRRLVDGARPSWRLVSAAGLMAVALVVGSVLLPASPRPGTDEPATPTPLGAVLLATAQASQRQPDRGSAAVRYQRQRWYEPAFDSQEAHERLRELWLAADGSGRLRESGPGEHVFEAELVPGDQDWYTAEQFATVQNLPTDPAALARRLRGLATAGPAPKQTPSGAPADPDAALPRPDRTEKPLHVETFVLAAQLLVDPVVRSDVRAGLYRMLSDLEGVQLLGPATDRQGRAGTAIAVSSSHSGARERFELLFDQATGQPLQYRVLQFTSFDGTPLTPPETSSVVVVEEQAIVEAIGQRP